MTIEEAEKLFSEEKYRENLYHALENLKKAYDTSSRGKNRKADKEAA